MRIRVSWANAAAALVAAAAMPVADAAGARTVAAQPHVVASPELPTDRARDAAWQAFFASLPHGPELAALNVRLATREEVARRCGEEAGGCYIGLASEIVIPGYHPPDGSLTDDIARHEYGHHLAAHSDNAPFSPGLGTKRWFTHEHICERLRSGELVDDPGVDYERSVEEGFAEAYRVAAGGDPHRWIVDGSLFPDTGARRAILADALHPWTGNRERRLGGRLARGAPSRTRALAVGLDGEVRVTVTGAGRLRPELTLADPASGRVVARGHRAGRRASLRYVDCGRRLLRLTVTARSGSGRYTVDVSTP